MTVVIATTLAATTLVALPRAADAGAADTATQLVISFTGSGVTGGTAFPTQPVVTFEDASNAVVTSETDTVSLAITAHTGAAGAALTCQPVAAVAGVATFSGCSIDKASTSYQLTASSIGLSVTSTTFTVAVGAPAQVAFVDQPASIVSGTTFATSPQLA